MPTCFSCGKNRSRTKEYYGLTICNKCYEKLGLGNLENDLDTSDEFLERMVMDEDKDYIEALNRFAAAFPKKDSEDLLGMSLINIDHDEEMDEIALSSFIIASRAVLLFGKENDESETDVTKIHFLLGLGTIIAVSIIRRIGKTYVGIRMGVDEEEIEYHIFGEFYMTMTGILNEMRYADTDFEFRDMVLRLYEMITGYCPEEQSID